MQKFKLRYGIIGGLISSLLGTLNWLFIAQSVGVQASQTVGYLSILVSLLCIPFGVRYFRDKLNSGQVEFGQAFLIGLGITVVAGIVMAIHSILFFVFQKEEFMEWQRSGLSSSELASFNEQIAQTPDYIYTPWFQGIVMFLMVFLMGIVVNIVSAFIMQRKSSK